MRLCCSCRLVRVSKGDIRIAMVLVCKVFAECGPAKRHPLMCCLRNILTQMIFLDHSSTTTHEIDIETAGRKTGPCDVVHLNGDGQILYAPSVMEIRYGLDGIEQDRRPISIRPSNLVTPAPPVWSGILLSRDDVIRKYALTRAYSVMHTNALEFDFLYGIAAYLDKRGAMVQVGSGRQGRGPIICERNGSKYRGFLDGRIQGDAMRLVLYLAAFELAASEERP